MTNKAFQIFLSEPQVEVLTEIVRASGDTIQDWLQDCVISMLRSDIDLYFGSSEALTRELNRKLQIEEEEAAQ